jgi:hypothetical protein
VGPGRERERRALVADNLKAIGIEQLDVLRVVAGAQLFDEIGHLVFSQELRRASTPLVAPEDEHGANCSLVLLH